MYANAFFIGYDLTFIAYPVNFLSFRVTLLSLQCWKKRATADAAVKSCSRSKQITAFGRRKSGKRERIRNILKKENGLPQPFTYLACRLGRCFCFAEVSAGHPHRNDKRCVLKILEFILQTCLRAVSFWRTGCLWG